MRGESNQNFTLDGECTTRETSHQIMIQLVSKKILPLFCQSSKYGSFLKTDST